VRAGVVEYTNEGVHQGDDGRYWFIGITRYGGHPVVPPYDVAA
jgi:hypothetical protein